MTVPVRAQMALALLLGIWLGVLGAFQHLRSIGPVPVGAVLAVVALTVAVRAVALVTGRRRVAVLVLLGWVIMTGLLVLLAPGGDIVLTDQLASYVYLLGGVIAPTTAATLPAVPLRSLATAPDVAPADPAVISP